MKMTIYFSIISKKIENDYYYKMAVKSPVKIYYIIYLQLKEI